MASLSEVVKRGIKDEVKIQGDEKAIDKINKHVLPPAIIWSINLWSR